MEVFMEYLRINATIIKNGELIIKHNDLKKGNSVETIVFLKKVSELSEEYMTGKELANSEIIGMWSNRDINDATDYANELRKQISER